MRFGSRGSEEVDLGGSRAYVESPAAADRPALDLYLNLDLLAAPNAGYVVQGGVGTDEAETGPSGSVDVARVLAEQLALTGVPPQTTAFEEGDSDHQAFPRRGHPVGRAALRRRGGQERRAGEEFDVCYHQACDRTDTLDRGAPDRSTDAVAGTLAHVAVPAEP